MRMRTAVDTKGSVKLAGSVVSCRPNDRPNNGGQDLKHEILPVLKGSQNGQQHHCPTISARDL